MAEAIPLTRVFITTHALVTGVIEAAWAEIEGDGCRIRDPEAHRFLAGEGSNWHRTKLAAENYARQRQAEYLAQLRAEIARLEGFRFGRPGA